MPELAGSHFLALRQSSILKLQLFPERTTWRGDVVLALFNNPHSAYYSLYKIQLLAFIIFISVVNCIQFICGLLVIMLVSSITLPFY